MANIKRLIHDALHILLIPFSLAVVFSEVSHTLHEFIERADLAVHIIFLALTIHSLKDWWKARRMPVRQA